MAKPGGVLRPGGAAWVGAVPVAGGAAGPAAGGAAVLVPVAAGGGGGGGAAPWAFAGGGTLAATLALAAAAACALVAAGVALAGAAVVALAAALAALRDFRLLGGMVLGWVRRVLWQERQTGAVQQWVQVANICSRSRGGFCERFLGSLRGAGTVSVIGGTIGTAECGGLCSHRAVQFTWVLNSEQVQFRSQETDVGRRNSRKGGSS